MQSIKIGDFDRMRESYYPDKQPEKIRKEKKEISDVSVSAKRKRMDELKQQISKIEETSWRLQSSEYTFGLTRQEKIVLESRRKKKGALMAEINKLKYDLMSPEERLAIKEEMKRLHIAVDQFDRKNNSTSQRLKWKFWKLTGVVKDQWSLARYAARFPDRDAKAMKQVREKYRTWGEEASDVIFKKPAVDLFEEKL